MGEYVVTGPDGKEYEVTAPDGAADWEIISQVQSYIDSQNPAPAPQEDVGFWGATGNAIMRNLNSFGTAYDNYMAEELAKASDAEEEIQRRRDAGELSTLDKLLTWRPENKRPGGADYESPEDLRSQAADYIQQGQLNSLQARKDYPMTQDGEKFISDAANAETFGEALSLVADRPLDALSGLAQVGVEQAPTIAASILGSAVTRNPATGMGIMGGSTYVQERFSQMAETAQKYGYDLTNPEQAKAAINDEAFMAEQEQRGMDRGIIIATVDAITLRAGSALPLNKKGLAGNIGLQMAGGGTGEALAQTKTDGGISKPGEVVIEALAEGITAPADVAMYAAGKRGQSGSEVPDVDPEAAAAEAALQKQAEEEQVAQTKATNRERLAAAPDFMSFQEFRNQRDAARIERIRDENTQEGQDFLDWLADTRTEENPAPTTEKELDKEIKAYIADTTSADDKIVAYDEYNAALDEHIEFRNEEAGRSDKAKKQATELKTKLLLDRATAIAGNDQEGLATVEAIAAELLTPGEWRHAKLVADGKLKKQKGGLSSKFTPEGEQVEAAPAADTNAGLAANASTEETADAAPVEQPADTTETTEVNQEEVPQAKVNPVPEEEAVEETAAPKVELNVGRGEKSKQILAELNNVLGENWADNYPDIAEKFNNRKDFYNAKEASETKIVKDARKAAAEAQNEAAQNEALDYANEKLGKEWRKRHPELLDSLSRKDYETFTAKVDEVLTKTPVDPNDALGEARALAMDYANEKLGKNWQENNPDLADMLASDDLKGFQTAVDDAVTAAESEQVDEEVDQETPVIGEGSNEQKALTNVGNLDLPPQQRAVWDVIYKAFLDGNTENIVDSKGRWLFTEIAKTADIRNREGNPHEKADAKRQAVRKAVIGLQPKIADAFGVDADQFAEVLASTRLERRKVEEAADKNDATQQFDENDLAEGKGFNTIESANQGARRGMSKADQDYLNERSNEKDEYESKRQEIADKERQKNNVRMVQTYGQIAVQEWKDMSSGSVPVNKLPKKDLMEWISTVEEFESGLINRTQLKADQKEIETRVSLDPNVQLEALSGTVVEGTATEVAESESQNTGAEESAESGNPTEQVGTSYSGETGERTGPTSKPVIVTKKRKKRTFNKPEFTESLGKGPAKYPTSKQAVEAYIEQLIGNAKNWRTHVYKNLDEVIVDRAAGKIYIDPDALSDAAANPNASAFVTVDKNGITHAYFLTDMIESGQVGGVVLHELGAHIGIQGLFSEEQITDIVNKIGEWAALNDGSKESKIAQAALERVGNLNLVGANGKVDMQLMKFETLAYFLEEAENANIAPNPKTAIGRFLRKIYAAFKVAARKVVQGRANDLTAKDIVHLARGAARAELEGKWHGTAASFRVFDHSHMGTGEGAQAYGWGTYLGSLRGVGLFYWEKDVSNKGNAAGKYTFKLGDKQLTINPDDRAAGSIIEGQIKNWLLSEGIADEANAGFLAEDIFLAAVESKLSGTNFIRMVRNRIDDIQRSLDYMYNEPEQYFQDWVLNKEGEVEKFISDAEANLDRYSRLLEAIKADKFEVKASGFDVKGSLMRVDILAEDSEFLDWDAKLDEQPTRIKPVIEQIVREYAEAVGETMPVEILMRDLPGQWLYQRIAFSRKNGQFVPARSVSMSEADGDKAASEYLHSRGIKGAKHADGRSRAKVRSGNRVKATYNYVMFNEKDMVRIGAYAGDKLDYDAQRKTYSTKPGTIQFSERKGETKSDGVISVRESKVRDWVKDNMGSGVARFYESASSTLSKPLASLEFLYDAIERIQDVMPSAKTAYSGMKKQEAIKNELMQEPESIAVRAAALKPERYALLNDFLGKSTFFQKWGYDPTTYHPELFANKKVKIDPIMKQQFARLTDTEKQIVADIFAQGEMRRQRMQNFMKQLGVSGNLFTATSSLQGPYAPLKRFGKHAAVLKSKELYDLEQRMENDSTQQTPRNSRKMEELRSSGEHYVVQFFDTAAAAAKFRDANNTQNGGKFYFSDAFPRGKDFDNNRTPNSQVIEQIMGRLKADDKSGLSDTDKEAFRTMLREHYFDMMDERDARTSGARRLNRAGYDTDMIRSFMFHSNAQAKMISTMETGAEVNESLAMARKEAAKDRGNLQSSYNLLTEHYREMMRPDDTFFNAIQDRIAGFNTVTMLTTNIGYHLQNATQTLIAVNKLVGDFGSYTKAWGALFKGYAVANQAIQGGGLFKQAATVATLGLVDFNNQVEINVDALPERYRDLVRELQAHQLADVGLQEDLRQFNRFDTGVKVLNTATDWASGLAHRLYQTARYVEAYNRVSTAIAAFDMAEANPKRIKSLKKQTPIEYAVSAVQRTQGAFNGLDAPLLFKKAPKLTTQFRKYQVMMAWNYGRALQQAFAGETTEMKVIGARTLAVTLAHAAITSGVRGMPWIAPVVAMVMMLGADDEEKLRLEAMSQGSYENMLEQLIRENIDDEEWADLITRGVPAYFGWDVSGKIGHQNFFKLQPYSDLEVTRDGIPSYLFDVFAGPTAAQIRGFGAAAEDVKRGDYDKAIEKLSPRGLRQYLESYRISNEGMTFTNGEVMLSNDKIELGQILRNTFGVPDTEINKLKWTRSQQFEIEKFYNDRQSELRSEFGNAQRDGDSEAMSEVKKEWVNLQRSKVKLNSFFNYSSTAMRPKPVTDLIRTIIDRKKKASKDRAKLGTN